MNRLSRIIIIAFASFMALSGCKPSDPATFDWDNNDQIEYTIDYTVLFTTDHDSTMQISATCNYGTAKVVQVESENLVGADGKLVKNTFILFEDSVPVGKTLTLSRGDISYTGGAPNILHVQTVGSDDMVEIRISGSDNYTMYSIRDNMFFGPNDEQSFTIGGGQRFSLVLPIMTEEKYPKEKENHTIKIGFEIS